MPFKVGDNVKTKTEPFEFFRVLAVDDGGSYTLKNAYGATTTKTEAELEAATGFSANFAHYGPDLIELLTNVVVFGAGNLVLKKGFLNRDNVKFLVEDALYEFLLKGYAQPWEEMVISRDALEVAKAGDFVTQQDAMDAIGRTMTIAVLDILYRLVMKQGWKSAIWYDLRVATSFFISNIISRKMQTATLPYKPQ